MPITYEASGMHPVPPPAIIWRYMRLSRLVSCLHTSSLWFARADTFADRFEGSLPAGTVDVRTQKLRDRFGDDANKLLDWASSQPRAMRRFVCVNCWHESEDESMAMWQLYGAGHDGIAVQTTVARLIQSLSAAPERLFISRVKYLDFRTGFIPENEALSPFVTKDSSFSHEHEIRAVYWHTPTKEKPYDGKEAWFEGAGVPNGGVAIGVDLATLINSVYVSPTSSKWYQESVRAVLDKFVPGVALLQSRLAGNPLY
jgi:hypothetical protein